MLTGLTQPRSEGAGDPWAAGEPSSPEFWSKVQANQGMAESADITAARDARGMRPAKLPEDSPSRPSRDLVALAAPKADAPRPRIEAPDAEPPRVAARPWSTRTIEESDLAPVRPPRAPSPAPAVDAEPYPQTIVPYEATAAWVERAQRSVNAMQPAADAADREAVRQRWLQGAPAARPASPPVAARPPAPAPTPPAPAPAPPVSAANPVEAQFAQQAMGRRTLSERELLAIRNAMSQGRLDEPPTFNPLQAYPFLGDRSLPPEERARESVTDQWFGYDPKNKVTRRQIIQDIDAQLAARRARQR